MIVPSTRASQIDAFHDVENRENAWAQFQADYGALILNWCRERLDYHSAEDLAQEVFVKLWQALPDYQHDPARGRFRSWLKTIVSNALRDHLRRKRVRPESPAALDPTILDAGNFADANTQFAQELSGAIAARAQSKESAALQRVRARISEKTWQMFSLTALEGLPAKQVAAQLGVAVGTVFRTKFRVKQMVLEEYEDAVVSQ